MDKFVLKSPYKPTGDQPQAIDKLVESIESGNREQVLLGVTGSGKTFTMANIIERVNRPTLVLEHNKILAAQLCTEVREFFPDNAVEYFVSYYDYYQPEAYLPTTDTYIEKDLSINEEIERLRLSTASSLLSGRRDVIVISSVSCLYGVGNPEDFHNQTIRLKKGQRITQTSLMYALVDALYNRTEGEFKMGCFRVNGESTDVCMGYGQNAVRVEFFGNEIDAIFIIDPVTGARLEEIEEVSIYPANNFVTTKERSALAVSQIQSDLLDQCKYLEEIGKFLEAKRLKQRVEYDLEMIKEMGYCSGIENYSRYFDGRSAGTRPFCLLDYFPDDFITFIDESHVTIPQIRAMYGGDHSRKSVLIDYGFRLPAAADNRPLKFEEFEELTGQRVFVSATPADYELEKSEGLIVEQVVRPTGLLDPPIEIRPTENQVDDLLEEVRVRAERDERVLVTTLTKRMAEELDSYFQRMGVRCHYIHSDVDTMERVEIIEDFKNGLFDVLVGVNLLREGLDIPLVSLVAILDADKEGFLRSDTALTQTAGRAARNVNGLVIMYADSITGSMRRTLEETARRRSKQLAYNEEHHITPTQIRSRSNVLVASKGHSSAPTSYDDPAYIPSPDELGHGKVSVGLGLDSRREGTAKTVDGYVKADLAAVLQDPVIRAMSREQVEKCIKEAERNMKKAAAALDFPAAAKFRDEMWALQEYLKVWKE